jgi:hypothetical protein
MTENILLLHHKNESVNAAYGINRSLFENVRNTQIVWAKYNIS